MKIKLTMSLIFSLCIATNVVGQTESDPLVWDSEKLKEGILKKCQLISTTSDSTINLSTKEVFFEGAKNGTNITISFLNGQVSKISAQSNTKKGQLISEVYYWDNWEIREFQTLEFDEKKSKKGQWRNSQGKPSWEFNTFITDNVIFAATTNGLTREPVEWEPRFAEIGDKINIGIRKLEHFVSTQFNLKVDQR